MEEQKVLLSSEETISALLVIDVQYDFLPGGSLAVTDGDAILPAIQQLLDDRCRWKLVVASQDYHPSGHVSFASVHPKSSPFTSIDVPNPLATTGEPSTLTQMLWPDHCVQGTRGCEFEDNVEKGLNGWVDRGQGFVVQKGINKVIDAYSAFAPSHSVSSLAFPSSDAGDDANSSAAKEAPLTVHLRSMGITSLFIVGLATDYCVRTTALDAVASGAFSAIYVVEDAVKAVGGLEATQKVCSEFEKAGVRTVRMKDHVVQRMLPKSTE